MQVSHPCATDHEPSIQTTTHTQHTTRTLHHHHHHQQQQQQPTCHHSSMQLFLQGRRFCVGRRALTARARGTLSSVGHTDSRHDMMPLVVEPPQTNHLAHHNFSAMLCTSLLPTDSRHSSHGLHVTQSASVYCVRSSTMAHIHVHQLCTTKMVFSASSVGTSYTTTVVSIIVTTMVDIWPCFHTE